MSERRTRGHIATNDCRSRPSMQSRHQQGAFKAFSMLCLGPEPGQNRATQTDSLQCNYHSSPLLIFGNISIAIFL